jgi:hypothetical protein
MHIQMSSSSSPKSSSCISIKQGIVKGIMVPLCLMIGVQGASLAYAPPVSAATTVVPTKGFITKSGLKFFEIREGQGTTPEYGQLVSFFYTTYFRPSPDSPLERIDGSGAVPFVHKHGNGRIVRGIDEALHSMKPDGRRRIIVPKAIGYVDNGNGYSGPYPLSPKGIGLHPKIHIVPCLHCNVPYTFFQT